MTIPGYAKVGSDPLRARSSMPALMATTRAPRVFTSDADAGDISILDYLLRSEKDGEQYYRDLAAKAPNQVPFTE